MGMGWDSFPEGVPSRVREDGKEAGRCFSALDYGLLMKVVGSF